MRRGILKICKGRSRKPLAEVILWSAPLRATSSAFPRAHSVPSGKSLRIKARAVCCSVGISLLRGKIYVAKQRQE